MNIWQDDRFARIPIMLFTGFFLVHEVQGLLGFLAHPPFGWEGTFVAGLAARISLLIFLALLLMFHAIRSQPKRSATDWGAKLSALFGLTLSNLVLLLPRPELDATWMLASTVLLLLGNYLCIVALFHLGRSLSILAEARTLVTHGPYRWVRHPLYLAEEVAIVGVFLQFMSWPAAAILLLHFASQVARMRHEERVLSATFPEYADYARRTARLMPGVW